jgi:hypothetical protein
LPLLRTILSSLLIYSYPICPDIPPTQVLVPAIIHDVVILNDDLQHLALFGLFVSLLYHKGEHKGVED